MPRTRPVITVALLPEHARLLAEAAGIAAREGAHYDANERLALASVEQLLTEKLKGK